MRKGWLVLLLSMSLLAGCARTPAQKEARFLERGKQLMEQKNYGRAILEFRNAVSVKPDDAEAYYQLALAQLGAGENVSAANSLLKTTALNPKHSGAQLKMAELLVASPEKSTLEEAEKRIRAVLIESPKSVDALNILALTQWRLGKKEEAEELLKQTSSEFPANLQATVNLAGLKLSQKDQAGAEQIYRKAIESDPHSADLAIAFGNFYLTTGRPPQAEEQLRRALQIDPQRGNALVALASLKMRAGQNAEAEKLYEQASKLSDPKLKPLHAIFLFQTGKRDAGIAEFEKLVKQNPTDRSIRGGLVSAYQLANRTADAEKLLAGVLQKNAQDTDALLQRSELETMSGRYVEAQADLAKILRFYPDSAVAHYLMGRVYQHRGASLSQRQEWSEAVRLDPTLLGVRIQLAQLLISTNSAQSALDLLDQAPAEQKGSPLLAVQKNWVFIALGRSAEARKGIDQALSTAKTPEVLLQDATLKSLQRDFAGARKPLEEALRQNPEDIAALNMLVQAYDAQKQMPQAVEAVRNYVNQKPNSAPLQQFLGQLLAKNGDLVGARKALTTAKAGAGNPSGADLWLAQVDISEGKLDEARSKLTSLVATNPQDISTRLLFGTLEERAGNPVGAMQQYRKVVEVNDQNVLALNNLAFLLADAGQPEEALALAQKAKELAPENASVEDTLGWVFYRKGLYSSAIPYFERAVSKEPTGRRKCHLALAYLKNGDPQRGRPLLDAAVKMSPDLLKEPFLQQFLAEAPSR